MDALVTATRTARLVTVRWDVLPNEHGGKMLWLGSWLVGNSDVEGPWFYSGCGGGMSEIVPPEDASGIRIRRWPSDGLTPEYNDVGLDIGSIATSELQFDRRQPHSRLSFAPTGP